MKTKSVLAATLSLLTMLVSLSPAARADAGVFTGNGQDLHQISSKDVQLVSIDVTIIPGRGHFLFDGSVPGMDETEYYCKFVLKNLSNKHEEVQIGFPVDSQFAEYDRDKSPVISPKESGEWVSQYSFIARDEQRTYNVAFVRRKAEKGPGEFSELFTWIMSFAPMETRTLTVQYRMPMSMGLVSTRKDNSAKSMLDDPLGQELLNFGMEEIIGYITSTGSSWSGNVERATFTVITRPFERYLDLRGVVEEPPGSPHSDESETYRKNFPVKHPWWFRSISPAGWMKVENGIQWRYNNFKPHDPIVITYCMTELPRLPDEVSPFIQHFLDDQFSVSTAGRQRQPHDGENHLSTEPSRVIELTRLKELLLATYGKEPQDPILKRHVVTQLWYEPHKDFSMAKLSDTQKAVLREFDKWIDRARAAQ